jgi:mannose-6-phosphate isomerase-like protein (cupin superfamily)
MTDAEIGCSIPLIFLLPWRIFLEEGEKRARIFEEAQANSRKPRRSLQLDSHPPRSVSWKNLETEMPETVFFHMSQLDEKRTQAGRRYFEFLRIPAMSSGIYVLGVGDDDPQTPHREDEVYYVVRGKARMQAGSEDQKVGEGSVIFVAAGVKHRFYDVTEELLVLVFFAPAESA